MKKTQNKLVFVNGCRIQSCNAINLGILVLRLGWRRIVYIEHYDGFNFFSSSNKLLEREIGSTGPERTYRNSLVFLHSSLVPYAT